MFRHLMKYTLKEYIEYVQINYNLLLGVEVAKQLTTGAMLYTPPNLSELEHELLALAVKVYSE